MYPESIFVRRRKYGLVVYQSVQPQLNEYITDCLKAVEFHSNSQQLKKFIVCINAYGSVIEKYVIDVLNVQQKLEEWVFNILVWCQFVTNVFFSLNFFVKLETSLREFCLKLQAKVSYLNTLPNDASFNIQLHTTELAKEEFNSNPVFEVRWVTLRIHYFVSNKYYFYV